VQEAVKADDALDARARQAERRGDARDGARRQPVETFLRPDEDLQQARRIAAVSRQPSSTAWSRSVIAQVWASWTLAY